ncbi:hypothetical protein C3731_07450 [Brucella oryzae]|uniref:Uncharacterized protein n=3 Tax=Brucella TaxID=234 RepID=A0A2S7J1M4_9HYPH|nr:hypothetical protein C3731_07450 [Brucella oryzae]
MRKDKNSKQIRFILSCDLFFIRQLRDGFQPHWDATKLREILRYSICATGKTGEVMIASFREDRAKAGKPRLCAMDTESHLTATAAVTIETRLSQ